MLMLMLMLVREVVRQADTCVARFPTAGAGVAFASQVEATGGLVLAAFSDAGLAVSTCLETIAAMPTQPWCVPRGGGRRGDGSRVVLCRWLVQRALTFAFPVACAAGTLQSDGGRIHLRALARTAVSRVPHAAVHPTPPSTGHIAVVVSRRPAALLENALCEELAVAGVDPDGKLSHRVLFRGLRVKVRREEGWAPGMWDWGELGEEAGDW